MNFEEFKKEMEEFMRNSKEITRKMAKAFETMYLASAELDRMQFCSAVPTLIAYCAARLEADPVDMTADILKALTGNKQANKVSKEEAEETLRGLTIKSEEG